MTGPESAESKIQRIVAQCDDAVRKLRGDKLLSAEGKQARIASAYHAASTAAAAIRDGIAEREADERKMLERKLFSPTPQLMTSASDRIARDASYRDAFERASATDAAKDPHALQTLLARAVRTDDQLQARAAMAVALERSDTDTLNAYVQEHPTVEPDVQRLADLVAATSAPTQLMRAIALAGPAKPAELHGLSDSKIAELANGPMPAPYREPYMKSGDCSMPGR